MDIDGPLKIGVLDREDGRTRELHVEFRESFRELGLAAQGEGMRDYLDALRRDIAATAADDPNRAGMLIVQQIAEQLLPYVEGGEIALNDTIVVEIGPAVGDSLRELVRQQGS